MTTLLTKHQRLAALRPLSPESVASLAAAWDVRMVGNRPHHRSSLMGSGRDARATWRGRLARRQADHLTEVDKMIPQTHLLEALNQSPRSIS